MAGSLAQAQSLASCPAVQLVARMGVAGGERHPSTRPCSPPDFCALLVSAIPETAGDLADQGAKCGDSEIFVHS